MVKLARSGWRLSLLAYPGFFEEAFPTLAASWVVDLGARAVTARAYAADDNPPILHRKELLLPQGPPDTERRARLLSSILPGLLPSGLDIRQPHPSRWPFARCPMRSRSRTPAMALRGAQD